MNVWMEHMVFVDSLGIR